MKSGTIFWGTFFLVLGAVLLLENAGIVSVTWWEIWRFWPLALVIWGITLLVGGTVARAVAAAVAAVVLALALASFINFTREPWGPLVEREVEEDTFTVPMVAGGRTARLSLDAGAGTYELDDTTSDLFAARTRTSLGQYEVRHESADGEERIDMRLKGEGRGRFGFGRAENRVGIRLNPLPEWDLEVDAGASRVALDLRPFVVRTLDLNTGATSANITLGQRSAETSVRVNSGASTLRIEVPKTAGCEVWLKAPLSSKHLDDFRKVEKGHYVTENLDSASCKIRIDIDVGVSAVRITRYDASESQGR